MTEVLKDGWSYDAEMRKYGNAAMNFSVLFLSYHHGDTSPGPSCSHSHPLGTITTYVHSHNGEYLWSKVELFTLWISSRAVYCGTVRAEK